MSPPVAARSRPLHRWDLTPKEARALQEELRSRVSLRRDRRRVRHVAGVDAAFPGGRGARRARAAVVVLRFPELEPVEEAVAETPLAFPYVPGLLTFREGPAVLAAWRRLRTVPDLVLFDGQGIAHPRGLGIAAHLGLWLDLPSIGVAKSRLCGSAEEPGGERGEATPLGDDRNPRQRIGTVLRTRTGVKPLWISPGHRMDHAGAVRYVLDCGTGTRLPEPTRLADALAAGRSVRPAASGKGSTGHDPGGSPTRRRGS